MTDFITVPVRFRDVECKLVLPAGTDDPVVAGYARGEAMNAYLSDLLVQFVAKPATVLDLGCHVGTFSVVAAALGYRVIAVDASPLHVEAVRRSAEINGLDQLLVIHGAVADRARTVRFNEAGLFGAVVPEGSGTLDVAADTVPALLAAAGADLADVGFVKADVEGSELQALAGMAEHLAGPSAPPVVYESNPMTSEPMGFTVDGIRTALEVLGYRTYRTEADQLFVCPPMEPQPEAWVDHIALKDAHLAAAAVTSAGAWPRQSLVGRIAAWAALPHPNVREYVAGMLARHWGDLGAEPTLQAVARTLAADDEPGVRAAMAPVHLPPADPPAPAPADVPPPSSLAPRLSRWRRWAG